jgi:hypothetical protein
MDREAMWRPPASARQTCGALIRRCIRRMLAQRVVGAAGHLDPAKLL